MAWRVPQVRRHLRTYGWILAISVGGAFAIAGAQEPDRGGPTGRGPRGLSGFGLFTALDTDGQPGLSPAEIDRATTTLTALDANHDGQLTAGEVPMAGRGGRRGFPGRGGPEGFRGRGGRGDEPGEAAPTTADDLADTLMAFDQNKDGKLTRAEVPERFQGLFDRADANKDGQITADELKQAASAQPGPASQGRGRDGRGEGEGRGGRDGGEGRGFFGGPDPLVSVLDTNKDGALSAEEPARVPEVLRGFDRNGDGTVMIDEIFQQGRGRG
jgi:Ca2+-binding EF-hand superfamily protein